MPTNANTDALALLPSSVLDDEICNGNDSALDESTKRVTLALKIMAVVRKDIERAYLHGTDAYLDFEPAGFALVIDGVSTPLNVTSINDGISKVQDALGKYIPCRVVLTPAQMTLVLDELDRCSDQPDYKNVTIKSNTVMGTRNILHSVADGLEASLDDDSLAFKAEQCVVDGRRGGDLSMDALEARAGFVLKSLQRSRDGAIKALRKA